MQSGKAIYVLGALYVVTVLYLDKGILGLGKTLVARFKKSGLKFSKM